MIHQFLCQLPDVDCVGGYEENEGKIITSRGSPCNNNELCINLSGSYVCEPTTTIGSVVHDNEADAGRVSRVSV